MPMAPTSLIVSTFGPRTSGCTLCWDRKHYVCMTLNFILLYAEKFVTKNNIIHIYTCASPRRSPLCFPPPGHCREGEHIAMVVKSKFWFLYLIIFARFTDSRIYGKWQKRERERERLLIASSMFTCLKNFNKLYTSHIYTFEIGCKK